MSGVIALLFIALPLAINQLIFAMGVIVSSLVAEGTFFSLSRMGKWSMWSLSLASAILLVAMTGIEFLPLTAGFLVLQVVATALFFMRGLRQGTSE